MKPALVGVLGLAVLLAACGGTAAPAVAPSPTQAPASAAPTPAPTTAPAAPSPSVATQPVQLFFTAGGKLAAEAARVNGQSPARDALNLLLKGPQDSGHFSEIPKDVQLQDVAIKDGTASVSFNANFFGSGGATGTQLRLAQVVYTLTQFPGVSAVQFLQDGKPLSVAAGGGEGFPLNRPLTRANFARLATA